jgi:tripartite-type tricarboxylate transporter receptor subunit TctC
MYQSIIGLLKQTVPIRRCASILLISCTPFCAYAQQAYPARPVRVIVPYPPGGGNDIIARAVVDELSRRTSQQFYVDNRPGASTIIGAELAAKAPPDGYTLFVSSQTTLAIVPNLKSKVPYDPVRDYEPVSLLATQPYLVVVHPSLPVHNVRQLSALARARPGKIVYGSSGIGTGGHLSAELFKVMTHTDMLHVPYKGGAQAVTDLLGGHVSVMFATMSSVYQQAMSDKVRPIAITSAVRSPAAPKVPTVAESGVPGYETVQWIAMSAPRATPKNVIDRLNAELAAGVKSPELRERLSSQGYDPASSTPQQLGDYIKVEFARFGKLIKAIALKDE